MAELKKSNPPNNPIHHPKPYSMSRNTKYAIIVFVLFILAATADYISRPGILQHAIRLFSQINTQTASILCTMLLIVGLIYIATRPRKIYLVDFACYKPDSSFMISKDETIRRFRQFLGDEAAAFHKKVMDRSGMGDKVYVPSSFVELPPKFRFNESRSELEMVIFGAIDGLLEKTRHVKAQDIGIVIVNSSTFSPTPSLSDTIVNQYKLNVDVVNYDLGGMGCSAGLISIDLAEQLLQVRPNTYALVVSVESITNNFYSGNINKSMMLSNCLFRMGGAAILLSNKSSERRQSKYQLKHVIRTHKGADDRAYKCVSEEQDEKGVTGISLSKDLMGVAAQALKSNIMTLGPLVLPITEQLRYLSNFIERKVLKMKIKPYVPDFKRAFEHFCIHAGGRGILDEMEVHLALTEWHIEPSRMTLYRFGNTSSSSVWYELAYSEAKGRIKKNDRIWQIAFGSGFKCNSAVWRALKPCKTTYTGQKNTAWVGEIDEFPAHAAKVMPNGC
ncbi:hypothetical protein LIER_15356 [Lithospermum erythrorhizon]|uniref:3-ketoacyl-CoA synthase n=1 Tax=Lithospermum erythrorhizon TaxID=34254 RepID=A0AAV3Q4Z8_LITER